MSVLFWDLVAALIVVLMAGIRFQRFWCFSFVGFQVIYRLGVQNANFRENFDW